MNLDMPSATLLVGFAAGIAAIVATGGNLLNAWLIRRSEERRQIRELAVRAAIEEWTKHIEMTPDGNSGHERLSHAATWLA